MRLQKEQQKGTTIKNSIKTCGKMLSKPSSQILFHKISLIKHSSNANIVVYKLSLMGIGKWTKKREIAKLNNTFVFFKNN